VYGKKFQESIFRDIDTRKHEEVHSWQKYFYFRRENGLFMATFASKLPEVLFIFEINPGTWGEVQRQETWLAFKPAD